jgi:hypothetical protein
MYVINALPDLEKSQKAAFNRCRVFFGVTFLSKITTADDNSIARDAWDGTRPWITPLLWPHQPHVGPKTKQTLRRLLATAFLAGSQRRVSVTTRNLALRKPLGSWLPNSDGFRLHWDCFFSAATNNLYRRQANTSSFDVHALKKNRHRPKHPIRGFNDDIIATCDGLPQGTRLSTHRMAV